MNNARLTSFASLSFKVLGGVLLISSLVDYVLAIVPWMPLDSAWQVNFTNQLVGQGITTLIGIVALLMGSWLEQSLGKDSKLRFSLTDSRLLSFFVAIFLGIIFLVLIPLNVINLRDARQEAITQIEAEVELQQQQVQGQYNQLQAIAQNSEAQQQLAEQIQQIEQALNEGQVPAEQIEQFEAQKQELVNYQNYTNNTESLDARLAELEQEVNDFEADQRNEANRTLVQAIVQTGTRSLLLAIGYLVIGGIGIKQAWSNRTNTATKTGETPNSNKAETSREE